MATDTALFIGWNRPIAGREQQALQLFEASMGYYSGLAADKRIASFEPVLLSAHAGDLNGFVLLRGSAEQIDKVRRDEKFIDIMTEAQYCVDQVGVVDAVIAEGMQPLLQRWAKLSSGK